MELEEIFDEDIFEETAVTSETFSAETEPIITSFTESVTEISTDVSVSDWQGGIVFGSPPETEQGITDEAIQSAVSSLLEGLNCEEQFEEVNTRLDSISDSVLYTSELLTVSFVVLAIVIVINLLVKTFFTGW